MELIIGVIALFFGFRLIGLIFHALFALIGLVFRIWLFGVAAGLMLVLLIAGGLGGGHSDSRTDTAHVQTQQTYQTPPKVAAKQETLSELSPREWTGLGLGLAVMAGGVLWLCIHLRRRSASRVDQTDTTVSETHRFSAPHFPLSHGKNLLKIERQSSKEIELLELADVDVKSMADFRKREPWVLVDVPPKFFESFLRECAWLKQKTKKDATEIDQVAVLRDVSVGWAWSKAPGRSPPATIEQSKESSDDS